MYALPSPLNSSNIKKPLLAYRSAFPYPVLVSDPSSPIDRLTPRERSCLELVVQLYDSKEIAGRLGLSPATVNRYLHDATRKLGGRNRKHAARILEEHLAQGGTPPAPLALKPAPSENWGKIGGIGVSGPSVPEPPLRPIEAAALQRASWWYRALHFERAAMPSAFTPLQRLLIIIGLTVVFSVCLGLAVITAVGLVSIYGSLRP